MTGNTAASFRSRLGPISAAGSSIARMTRVFTIDGIRHERWLIPGAMGDIPAYILCSEDASAPRPGLLALHSHDRQFDVGKSGVVGLHGDPTQALGRIAADLGFVVLAPDLPGFEDHRPPLADRKKSYSLQGEGYERLLAMNALLWGGTLQGRITSDLHACVSTLAADPRADPLRVFAAGHSFGGQEAIWTTLLDERVAGCLSSCGFSLVSMIAARNISHNLALYVPGLLPDLDFDMVVSAIAERPLFAIAAEDDAIYPVDGVRHVEARVGQVLGSRSRAQFHYLPGSHAFSTRAVTQALRSLIEAGSR